MSREFYKPAPPPSTPDFTQGHARAMNMRRSDFIATPAIGPNELSEHLIGNYSNHLEKAMQEPNSRLDIIQEFALQYYPELAAVYTQIPEENKAAPYTYMKTQTPAGKSIDRELRRGLELIENIQKVRRNNTDETRQSSRDFFHALIREAPKKAVEIVLKSEHIAALPPGILSPLLEFVIITDQDTALKYTTDIFANIDRKWANTKQCNDYDQNLGMLCTIEPELWADMSRTQRNRVIKSRSPILAAHGRENMLRYKNYNRSEIQGRDGISAYNYLVKKAREQGHFNENLDLTNALDIFDNYEVFDYRNHQVCRDAIYLAYQYLTHYSDQTTGGEFEDPNERLRQKSIAYNIFARVADRIPSPNPTLDDGHVTITLEKVSTITAPVIVVQQLVDIRETVIMQVAQVEAGAEISIYDQDTVKVNGAAPSEVDIHTADTWRIDHPEYNPFPMAHDRPTKPLPEEEREFAPGD